MPDPDGDRTPICPLLLAAGPASGPAPAQAV